jgi:hypothetical protein
MGTKRKGNTVRNQKEGIHGKETGTGWLLICLPKCMQPVQKVH